MEKERTRAQKILDLAEEIGEACQASDLGQSEIQDAWHIASTLMQNCAWFRTRDRTYLNPGEGDAEEEPSAKSPASEVCAPEAVETDGPKFREFF